MKNKTIEIGLTPREVFYLTQTIKYNNTIKKKFLKEKHFLKKFSDVLEDNTTPKERTRLKKEFLNIMDEVLELKAEYRASEEINIEKKKNAILRQNLRQKAEGFNKSRPTNPRPTNPRNYQNENTDSITGARYKKNEQTRSGVYRNF